LPYLGICTGVVGVHATIALAAAAIAGDRGVARIRRAL